MSGAPGLEENARMITGAHAILFSQDAEADRDFFRDVLKFEHVDAGGGWLIFAPPPDALAAPPGPDARPLYLVCDDIAATTDELRARGVETSAVNDQGCGLLSAISVLPG